MVFITAKQPARFINSDSQNDSGLSIDSANSVLAVVNKGRKLSNSYVPSDLVVPRVSLRLESSSPEMQLRYVAARALERLVIEARNNGLELMLTSAYRSYDQQVGLYNFYTEKNGQASADGYSARPGHSEHQTGLAVDLAPLSRFCELEECFGDTPEGKWLASNAPKYGFIIRYEKGNRLLTGYEYEPWHVRYIGEELASKINSSGQTLEQHFKLPARPDYPAKIYTLAD